MKVWLVSVITLFGLAEFYQWASASNWLEQIALLPLPVLVAAGFALAIASNAKKHLPWQPWPPRSTEPAIEPAANAQPPQPLVPPTARSISFKIGKSESNQS